MRNGKLGALHLEGVEKCFARGIQRSIQGEGKAAHADRPNGLVEGARWRNGVDQDRFGCAFGFGVSNHLGNFVGAGRGARCAVFGVHNPTHLTRRLFNDDFILTLASILQPEGLVHHWSDVADYFEMVQGLMDHHPDFTRCPTPAEREATGDMDYHTSFERKKRKLGSPIYRGLWQRKAAGAG